MNIINLTPHIVRLNDGREFPPSGSIARVATSYAPIEEIEGLPFTRTTFGDVTGLPEQTPDTLFIVSGVVASACPDRSDLIAPTTNHPQAIRRDGQIWSVPCFTRNNDR